MPRKTKAERAEYMRNYRAGKAHIEFKRSEARAVRPAFMVAPIDECPLCHHDRQEADHLGGRPCRFKTSPRRNCGCMFEGF